MKHRYFIGLFFLFLFLSLLIVFNGSVVAEEQPFIYADIPENSFGISEFKELNWSFIEDCFSYSLYVDGENISDGLFVNWSYYGQYKKISYDFFATVKGYHVFDLYFDSGATTTYLDGNITIAYPDGVLFFDINDILALPVDVDWTIIDNVFHLTVGIDVKNKNTHISLDPAFGREIDPGSRVGLSYYWASGVPKEYVKGLKASPGSSGTADNITVRLQRRDENGYVKCGLFDSSSNFIAETEVILITDTNEHWKTFNFSSPPSITQGNDYYIVAYGDAQASGDAYTYVVSIWFDDVGPGYNELVDDYGTWNDPATFTSDSKNYSIYCSYTESSGWSNTAPVQSDFRVNWTNNNSIDVILYPQLNITTVDADGNATNIYWSTNGSALYQINSSSPNGTYYDLNFSFASAYDTVYQVNISVNDSHDNISAWYRFTTESAPWSNTAPVQSAFTVNTLGNNSVDIALYPQLNITVVDADGNNTVVYWSTNGSAKYQINASAGNRTCYDLNFSFASAYDTVYQVNISVNDTHDNVSAWYRFTTESAPWSNTAPVQTDFRVNSTNNGSVDVVRWPQLNITTVDADGNATNIYWSTNGSALYQVNLSSPNGTYYDLNFSFASAYDTVYQVNISVNDTHDNVSAWYRFTTRVEPGAPWSNTCPVSSVESPSNKSTSVSISVGFWNITINDADGNTTTGNITCSNGNWSSWSAQANGTRSCNLSTLSYDTNYTVYVNYTDTLGVCSENETYWFVTCTNTSGNIVITNEFPSNNTYLQSLQPTVYFTLTNPSGRTMNYTIYIGNSSANTTTVLDNDTGVGNGTYHYTNYFTASNYTSYWWKVYANDSTQEINETFNFTCSRAGGGIISSGGGSIAIAASAMMIGVIALVFVFSKRRRREQ